MGIADIQRKRVLSDFKETILNVVLTLYNVISKGLIVLIQLLCLVMKFRFRSVNCEKVLTNLTGF